MIKFEEILKKSESMKRILGLSLLAVLTLASCKKNEATETSTATTATEQKDPFADDRVVKQSDLVSEAKNHAETTLALSEPDFNFGKIKKGDKVAQCTLKEHKGYLLGYESDVVRVSGFGSTGI